MNRTSRKIVANVHVRSLFDEYRWKEFRQILRDSVDYIKEFTGGEVSYKMLDPKAGNLTFSWYDNTNFNYEKIVADLNSMFIMADFELLE